MKKIILLSILIQMHFALFAQNPEGAEKLIEEGIKLHDKGEYKAAINKYEEALAIDRDNFFGLSEKAMSLLSLKSYDESIKICKDLIQLYKGNKNLKTIYVTYGNGLDAQKKTIESIAIYDDGIKAFPDYYQLYFNKAVTLLIADRPDEAQTVLEKAIVLNPDHPGSQNAMVKALIFTKKNVPALLVLCRFLILEPESERASENLKSLQKILMGNVEKTSEKSMTINISPDILDDSKKKKDNNFSQTDLLLAFSGAMDLEEIFKNENEMERLKRKLGSVFSSIKDAKKGNSGFFWKFYAPYFIELYNQNFTETLAYISFASTNNTKALTWLEFHRKEIDSFYEWNKNYQWKMK
jgi:tetratricopeptide (TPR) repeat protein